MRILVGGYLGGTPSKKIGASFLPPPPAKNLRTGVECATPRNTKALSSETFVQEDLKKCRQHSPTPSELFWGWARQKQRSTLFGASLR